MLGAAASTSLPSSSLRVLGIVEDEANRPCDASSGSISIFSDVVSSNSRRQSIAEAVAEYDRLIAVYPALGYDIHVLPKVSAAERANWILASLAS
jgi:hypothetical protein